MVTYNRLTQLIIERSSELVHMYGFDCLDSFFISLEISVSAYEELIRELGVMNLADHIDFKSPPWDENVYYRRGLCFETGGVTRANIMNGIVVNDQLIGGTINVARMLVRSKYCEHHRGGSWTGKNNPVLLSTVSTLITSCFDKRENIIGDLSDCRVLLN